MAKVTKTILVGFLVGLTMALATAGTGQAQPTFPALSGRVVDEARLLSEPKEAEIIARLAALQADTGAQLVVVTVNSLQGYEIEDYGYQVGYGLEPILTDALSNQIIQTDILPPFREGGFERGITSGVDAIDTQLRLDPAEAQARAAAAEPTGSEAPVLPALIIVVIFFLLFASMVRAAGGGRRRRRGDGGLGPILLWTAVNVLAGSGRSSSGGGFGGFSGGGGSFGGGGASGGW